ncbi:hypothetical protein Dsin_021881 [Dipteronia sinensis]|uniref:Reverse transcriptase domain-containing protein n=1 Tax=Dipteronia sinensis TaxID=43782 RepID=A0AAE0A1S5_9ROSI|nr:hypothetical protein Dsin_021881 [Dipteronia sinensis]
MNQLTALGSNGLPAAFFQKFWGTVGKSVTEACLEVLNEGRSPEMVNDTIITLIPEVQNPSTLPEFRPISLCNVVYKIIAKAITSENQCAFIPGRMISDNTIFGFECLHRLKRRKRKKGLNGFEARHVKGLRPCRVAFSGEDDVPNGFFYKLGQSDHELCFLGLILLYVEW